MSMDVGGKPLLVWANVDGYAQLAWNDGTYPITKLVVRGATYPDAFVPDAKELMQFLDKDAEPMDTLEFWHEELLELFADATSSVVLDFCWNLVGYRGMHGMGDNICRTQLRDEIIRSGIESAIPSDSQRKETE